MNEIAVQKFGFIPDCLSDFFVRDTIRSYFDVENEMMPSLVNITYDVSDPIGFQAAGYNGEKNIELHANIMSTMYGDELSTYYYKLVDSNFQPILEDVLKLVERLNLSYCFLDDPKWIKKDIKHYTKEVW